MRLGAILLFAFSVSGAALGGEWTTSSFEDFRKGQLFDAGSNLYVSHRGRVQMINRWDLNGDGHLDIVLPSGHAHTEKEDTYIYLNNGQDIDGRSLIKLPANGSTGGVLCDLNKDGYNDLVVCNGDNGMTTSTDLYIYFGGADGFSVARRLVLPAQRSSSVAAADFDGDGWIDVAVACEWRVGDEAKPKGEGMSFIYWNGPKGFSAKERSAFSFDGRGAQTVAAGDLNGDGCADLVMSARGTAKTYIYYSPKARFDGTAKRAELPIEARAAAIGDVNKDGKKDLALCSGNEVLIFRGRADGTLDSEPIHLAAKKPMGVVLCDVNKDGLDDVAIANYSGEDGATWVKSYVYLSDGKDFKSSQRMDLPTMGARAISAGDLNGDGYPELVISNERVTNQHNIPSCVFWNDHGAFRLGNHTELPTQGSVGNAIGDVNHDGKPDVVFFNFEGNFRDGASHSFIYWGDGTRNYSPQRMTDIDTHYITSIAHADLDDDGYVDLLLTQGRFISGASEDIFDSLIILWGGANGFERTTRLSPDNMGGGIRIADLNRDGYLDIIVGARASDSGEKQKGGLVIYWGSANGFSQHNRQLYALNVGNSRVPMIADINKDGYLDLVSGIKPDSITFWWGGEKGFSDDRTSELKLDRACFKVFVNAADLNNDGWLDLIVPVRDTAENNETTSMVYYGSANGFSNDRREELPTIGTYESSVADFDKDGWLDLVLTSYKGNTKANWPSYIYWGSPQGFGKRPRTELPTTGASGVETADYDGDGWIDILVSNHRRDGSTEVPGPNDHRTPSMLFWGGPDGFSPTRRWEAIGNGPHAMNVRDVGNTYDRGLYEDYTSESHPIPDGQHPTKLRWKAETPNGTRVEFQVRYAADAAALKNGKWLGPKGEGSWYGGEAADSLSAPRDAHFMQYRARLITPNGGPTPYLESVTVRFE